MGLRPERRGPRVTTEGPSLRSLSRKPTSEFISLRELFPIQELAPRGMPSHTSSPSLGPAQVSSQLSEEALRWVTNPQRKGAQRGPFSGRVTSSSQMPGSSCTF